MKRYCYVFVILIVVISLLFILTGCGENTEYTETTTKNNVRTNSLTENKKETSENNQSTTNFDYKGAAQKQMAMPNEGDTIAIIKVKDFGNIKVKFFSEIAPKAVENFTTHAKNGYYDGLTFHRVINEFMIQGGDPLGNGTGGESIWGEGFATELSQELVPYKGSLCMAMSMLPNSIGSQFFITQANYSPKMNNLLKQSGYPNNLLEEYKNYGGYLSLYLQYTVFGQVYEGIEIVDEIAKVETETTPEGQEDKPVKDVVIETIEVTTYKPE